MKTNGLEGIDVLFNDDWYRGSIDGKSWQPLGMLQQSLAQLGFRQVSEAEECETWVCGVSVIELLTKEIKSYERWDEDSKAEHEEARREWAQICIDNERWAR